MYQKFTTTLIGAAAAVALLGQPAAFRELYWDFETPEGKRVRWDFLGAERAACEASVVRLEKELRARVEEARRAEAARHVGPHARQLLEKGRLAALVDTGDGSARVAPLLLELGIAWGFAERGRCKRRKMRNRTGGQK